MSDYIGLHSKSWCPMPFLSLTIHPTNRLTHCMMSEVDMGSIDGGWDNDKFKEMRQRMLDGKHSLHPTIRLKEDAERNPDKYKDIIIDDVAGCNNCVQKEFRGLLSQRMNWLTRQHLKFPKGTFEQANKIEKNEIYHLNLNLSNICNFKCRMCSPAYSNSLIPEFKFFEKTDTPAREFHDLPPKQIIDVDKILEQYGPQLSNLKTIWVTGGEPFIDNRLVEFGEKLRNYCDTSKVDINITTNVSRLSIEQLKNLKHFGTLGINISIDSTGKLFEYMRSAGVFSWEEMDAKIEEIIAYAQENKSPAHKIQVSYNGAYQIYNCYNTYDFILYFLDKLERYPDGWIEYRMLTHPNNLGVQHANEKMRERAIGDIDRLLEHDGVKKRRNLYDMLVNCKTAFNTPRDDHQWLMFIKNCSASDFYRQQHLYDYAPELWNDFPEEDKEAYYKWYDYAKRSS